MQHTTIMLIASPQATQLRIHALLKKQRHLHVVAEVCPQDNVIPTAARDQPDIVIVSSDLSTPPVVLLVRELRLVSPASRIMVVGKLLDPTEHEHLIELGIGGFLLWADVTGEKLVQAIETIRTGLVVVNATVVERVVAVPERHRALRYRETVLTHEERVILDGKVSGLTQQEIAKEVHASVATVERILAGLRARFGVATTCALCARAVHAGFITFDKMDSAI